MPHSQFKLVANGGDWGSPVTSEPTFDSLEEAQAEARSFMEEQRKAGAPGSPFRITIEETRADGEIVVHNVA